jgi:5-methylcytosine-specific restriction protein A
VSADEISADDVLAAVEMLNDPEQDEQIAKLHFGPATKYRLVHRGRFYDSKAVAGVAHGVATGTPWTRDDLSGGVGSGQGARILTKLGFLVDDGPLFELTQLKVDRTHGKPAPYQYVVLLWAIAEARSGKHRMNPFSSVRAQLSELLAPFAIAKTAPDPAMPWLALRNTSWWDAQIPSNATQVTDADVRSLDLVAGLSQGIYSRLRDDQAFAHEAVEVIGTMIGHEPAFPPLINRLNFGDLGVTVEPPRTSTQRIRWAWDELVLACDLLAQNNWQRIPEDDLRVATLSQFLRRQPEAANSPDFRSIGSVLRKLENMRTMHPSYTGTPTRGGRATQQVIDAFVAQPAVMHRVAQALWTSGDLDRRENLWDEAQTDEPVTDTPDEYAQALEGRVNERLVRVSERDPKLRATKIAQSRKQRGSIACETCGFDFERSYGLLGEGFIHVHHRTPLHVTGPVTNTLADLILVCANCHSMIHRRSPWKTPEQLSDIISSQHASSS